MFEHCALHSLANWQFLGADFKVLGIVLLVLLPQDCGMLYQDLLPLVNLLVLLKRP